MSHHFDHVPSPEDLSELLPQYDIEKFIAKGGMGAVYKGPAIVGRKTQVKTAAAEFLEWR